MNYFWEGYREELIISSLVLSIAAIGSLFLAASLFGDTRTEDKEDPIERRQRVIAEQLNGAFAVLDMDDQVVQSDTPPHAGAITNPNLATASVVPTDQSDTPKPNTSNPPGATNTFAMDENETEVAAGESGLFRFDDYEVSLDNPRIRFDLEQPDDRTFYATVMLKNRSVDRGLPSNGFKATITQDGSVIASKTAMSSSVSTIVMPGEDLSFVVRISLIDGSEVHTIHYAPDGLVDVVDHIVEP